MDLPKNIGALTNQTKEDLLSIPVLEKYRWYVKQIPIDFENGNTRQALTLF